MRQPGIGAALGAMAVQHGRLDLRGVPGQAPQDGEVGRVGVAVHRQAHDAERQAGTEIGERTFGPVAAGAGIADDPDRVAGGGLKAHEVRDMAEEAADGRAEDVEDASARLLAGTFAEILAQIPAGRSGRPAGRDLVCRHDHG